MRRNCSNCKHQKEEGNQFDYYHKCTKHDIVVKKDRSICKDHDPNSEFALFEKKNSIGYREW